MAGAEHITMEAWHSWLSLVSFQTAGPVPVWQQGNCLQIVCQQQDITRHTVTPGMLYLHFSGDESRQLRQEQEEYEDTAENGNYKQRETSQMNALFKL